MVRVLSVVAILAVIALSAVVRTTPAPRGPAASPQRAVTLTALTQPLAATSTAAPAQPLELIGQQVNFHIAFVVDFVATGAELFRRQLAIPGTVLTDIQNGTPLPDALGRALVDFAQIELDAGRELVRFAVQYVAFQVQFVTEVLREVIAVAAAIPIAVASVFAGLMPKPSTEPSALTQTTPTRAVPTEKTPIADTPAALDLRPAKVRPSTDDDAVETDDSPKVTAGLGVGEPNRAKTAVTAGDTGRSTVSVQGEIRSPATQSAEPDAPTATKHDSTGHQGKADDQAHGHPEVHVGNADTNKTAPSEKADAVR